ncbi:MAG: hypothetical protein NC401_15330 [Ruminococcus sp.]|nr:hypothetical protein [Ruminococcus sp.]
MSGLTLLFGTGNPSKLEMMRESLNGLGIGLVSLRDMEKSPPEVGESGASPLENARIKALTYYRFYGVPVFSLDSGLFFENVPEELQPGVHVRSVEGKRLSDDEMIDYYSALARKYGGRLTARYKNALCLVTSEDKISESMDESLWGKAFYLTGTPHGRPHSEGFPLDRLSADIGSGKYYYDLPKSVETEMNKGFRGFFENLIKENLL